MRVRTYDSTIDSLLTPNGVIGKSGQFYSCGFYEHGETAVRNYTDKPFVCCREGIEAYFAINWGKPTKAQYDTLIDWCTVFSITFEDAVFNKDPWINFLQE